MGTAIVKPSCPTSASELHAEGGGFLSIDTARGEYDGILQLLIADLINVTAIGLITTRNPDGSPGFSLLLMLQMWCEAWRIPVANLLLAGYVVLSVSPSVRLSVYPSPLRSAGSSPR